MPYSTIVPLTPETVSPLAGDAVEVVVTRLDLEPDAFEFLAASLHDDELARARRFHLERDRRRYIVARARLRQMLGQRLGIQAQCVELAYGTHGKPVLAGGSATMDWRFNVSHSRDIAVFAFCRGREIGIDVEAVHRVYCADSIAERFFSRNEVQSYTALDPRDKETGFFNCWTRKEAFVKAVGEGLQYPLDSFDVSLAPHEPAAILRIGDAEGSDGGWCLRSFSPSPGYVAAVVVERSRSAANDDTFRKKPACVLWTP